MFWSPAVMTLSVTFGCAPTGEDRASANRAPASDAMVFMEPPFSGGARGAAPFLQPGTSSLRLRDIEMQRLGRQRQRHRVADGAALRIVDQELIVADAHGVAPDAARIGRLADPPAQHQRAVRARLEIGQPCRLAAE